MTSDKKASIHKDHRKRLKKKFKEYGTDSLAEHEILELMLFFGIPQGDTNPLAHALIKKYGSLQSVLDARYEDLTTCTGVGEHTAILLKLFPAVFGVYSEQKAKHYNQIVSSDIAIEYAKTLFSGMSNEAFYVICLNNKSAVKATKKIGLGSFNKVEIAIRDVTEFILKSNTDTIILAHNHPTGPAEPSDQDLILTHKLYSSCVLNDVDIVDHIIVAGDGNTYSFADHGLIKCIRDDVILRLGIDSLKLNSALQSSKKNYTSKCLNDVVSIKIKDIV